MAKGPRYKGFNYGQGDESNSPVVELIVGGEGTATFPRALHIAQASDADSDWNVAATAHPVLFLHSGTNAATEYISMTHDATCATINAQGATSLNMQISGTSETILSATVFDLASVDLQMQCGGQILDNAGLELIEFVTVCTAVNGFRVSNNSTGLKPVLTNEGEADTGIIFAGWDGTNTEEVLILCAASTAINEVTITSGASGTDAKIAGTTSATNAGLTLDTSGTGQITFQLGGTDSLNFHDVSGATFAAAATVAGHPVFVQSEDGGDACASTVAAAGGSLQLLTGDGGVAVCAAAAAAGGAFTLQSGAGGVGFASSAGNAANGGALCIVSGIGGNAGNNASSVPGVGGALGITAGAGGTATAACDAAAVGGTITITAGAGGAAAGACASAGGNGGCLIFFAGQGGTASSSCGANDGGDAGDIIFHLGTAVESGTTGNFILNNNTTGLGTSLATFSCPAWTAIGVIGQVSHTTALGATHTTAACTGSLVIKIS